MRVAFDIGGTFTDVIVFENERRIERRKVLSLLDRLGGDIIDCVARVASKSSIDHFVHGTTICSNAVIENKMGLIGLLTTKGFRDTLEMRGQKGPVSTSINWEPPSPLISRDLCLEVEERVRADGSVDTPLNEINARSQVRKLIERRVQGIAICFINSYLNPIHEKRVEQLILEMAPDLVVCLSSEIDSEMGEYDRSSTTAINTGLIPLVQQYLDKLQHQLQPYHSQLLIMQSNGGIMSDHAARKRPMLMVESGPAAGVLAAARLSVEIGLHQVISFDMGGTTAKACLIRSGAPLERSGMEIGAASNVGGTARNSGHILRAPTIDLVEVGAGGGSIAWIEGGVLRVGPHSTGADPGPACYGRGGEKPTVTDANLVLGRINPEKIANGTLRLDRHAAFEAIARLGAQVGMDPLKTAYGITQVANAVMMRVLRGVSTERGYDPREFSLMAFGGAGPLHAAALAESIGIDSVIVPLFPGLFSALGLLLADYRMDYLSPIARPLEEVDVDIIFGRYEEMELKAMTELRQLGLAVEGFRFERRIDIRYSHQADALTLEFRYTRKTPELRSTLSSQFETAHKTEFGHCGVGRKVLVNLRSRAHMPATDLSFSKLSMVDASDSPLGGSTGETREVYFGPLHGLMLTSVCSRPTITERVQGPVIVEEADTTVVVPPNWSVIRDSNQNLILRRARI